MMKKYKQLFMFNEVSEEEQSKKAVKDLIELDWGKDEDAQSIALQLFKGLIYADTKTADKFIQDVSDFTEKMNIEDYD